MYLQRCTIRVNFSLSRLVKMYTLLNVIILCICALSDCWSVIIVDYWLAVNPNSPKSSNLKTILHTPKGVRVNIHHVLRFVRSQIV